MYSSVISDLTMQIDLHFLFLSNFCLPGMEVSMPSDVCPSPPANCQQILLLYLEILLSVVSRKRCV